MRFGPVPLDEARGAILAHSLQLADGKLAKGHVLEEADIARLRASGQSRVIVARLDPGDVQEDEAAARLAAALVPDPSAAGLRLGRAATGRVNIHADGPGVAEILAGRINAVNAVHPMITVATVPEWQRTVERTMVATVKIISYAVPGAALERACETGRDALRLHRPTRSKVTLLQTFVGDKVETRGPRAVADRLTRMGAYLVAEANVAHDEAVLADALRATRLAAREEMILILTGSATSDPDDVAPAALRRAGGRVERFGMPVDPGNLLFLGALDDIPVLGLPGCARSPALNGADWVLERLLCDVPVTAQDIGAMGVGGLLMEIPTRPRPRDPRPRDPRPRDSGSPDPGSTIPE